MAEIGNIKDYRALSFKDRPYSAYCTVCWQTVYAAWVDKSWHGGACPFQAQNASDCSQATSWEQTKGEIKKYLLSFKEIEG